MYPPQFDYRRPATVEGALKALTEDGARVLAGGHSLVPGLKERATDARTLVDVGDLDELRGITREVDEAESDGTRASGATVVGAATTYADALDDGTLDKRAPGVAEAIAAVGDRQIRNRGTVGGNLVQADPGADVPAAALAAGASLVVRGPDGRWTVGAEELYWGADPDGHREPAATIESDELVTAVKVPDAGDAGSAYERKTHPARGYATVGVAARVWTSDAGEEITDARLAATGLRRTPIRLSAAEEALTGRDPTPAAASAAAERGASGLDRETVRSDPNVSGAYRLRVLPSYAEQTIERAIERSVGGSGGGDGQPTAADGGAP